MPVSMYTVSVPVFIQHLNGLNTVLDKAAAWAAARKISENDLLNMRLSPDLFNLGAASTGGYRSCRQCSGAFGRQRAFEICQRREYHRLIERAYRHDYRIPQEHQAK